MDKLILQVEHKKTALLLEFLRTLNYVKVEKEEEIEIPEWHKKVLDKRLKELKEHPESVIDLKTFKRNIKKKHGY